MKQTQHRWLYLDAQGKILTPELVNGTREALLKLKEQVVYLNETSDTFWGTVHSDIVGMENQNEREELLSIFSQVTHAQHFIETWIQTAVQDVPTFEFFVRSKAAEIQSGDDKKDYYWALNIRYDQLTALVKVLELLIKQLQRWVQMKPGALITDAVFLGLGDYNLEEQIYLEAERIHKSRPHSDAS